MAKVLFVACAAAAVGAVSALQFDLPASNTKCVAEVIGRDVLAIGKFMLEGVPDGSPSNVDVKVTSPALETEYQALSKNKGNFAFTAKTEGVHKMCFTNTNTREIRASIEFRVGVDAKDYSEVAKKEHLKPLELELRKLEDKAEEIYKEMSYQREREEQMRDTNESTNSRVLWFSVLSIVVLLGMGSWQIIYLRSFFKSSQLI